MDRTYQPPYSIYGCPNLKCRGILYFYGNSWNSPRKTLIRTRFRPPLPRASTQAPIIHGTRRSGTPIALSQLAQLRFNRLNGGFKTTLDLRDGIGRHVELRGDLLHRPTVNDVGPIDQPRRFGNRRVGEQLGLRLLTDGLTPLDIQQDAWILHGLTHRFIRFRRSLQHTYRTVVRLRTPVAIDQHTFHQHGQIGPESRLARIIALAAQQVDQLDENILNDILHVLWRKPRALQLDKPTHSRQIAFDKIGPDRRIIALGQFGALPQQRLGCIRKEAQSATRNPAWGILGKSSC